MFTAIRRASSFVSNFAADRETARGRAKRSFKKPCPHCQNLRGASKFGSVSINWSSAEERINTMSTLATTLYDEEVLHSDEVPDAVLELAGSKLWEGPAASFTAAFCTGLDTCPTSPQK